MNLDFLKNKKVLIGLLAGFLILAGAGFGAYYYFYIWPKPPEPEQKSELPKFKSCDTFVSAYKKGLKKSGLGDALEKNLFSTTPQSSSVDGRGGGEGTPEHSETNIQVEGVDEADIVKNDGKYIYTISKTTSTSNNSVDIVRAYPPEEAKKLSQIDFDKEINLEEMFIDDNLLAVIGSKYNKEDYKMVSFIKTYNTSDKEKPKLVRNIEYEGSYETSRKVDNNIYMVLSSSPIYYPLRDTKDIKPQDIIPKYKDEKEESRKALEPVCDCGDIGYIKPDQFSSFISIISMPIDDQNKPVDKKVIAGSAEEVYASLKNIYVISSNYNYYMWEGPNSNEDEKTNIYKFKMDGPSTQFLISSEVPGTVLNQFSMDEYNNYFRIATTKGQVWDEKTKAKNNVYVLDSELKTVGKIEGLAEGEKIYSARFMGNKAYLVTFKKVDPFFTLDMSDPKNPKVLGVLKIPGYSDYLHPYDENHIIGIGKNTTEATNELKNERGIDFAWYQGIKIAIFDVTDFANPKEMHKVLIGDRGTDSYALEDHKAFLFDKNKNLLVLPISLAELTEEQKKSSKTEASTYGEFKYQGAYVYDISLEGINLKGRITHIDDISALSKKYPSGIYDYSGDTNYIKRSLYIGDYLYTVSNGRVKANKLSDLSQVADIKLE